MSSRRASRAEVLRGIGIGAALLAAVGWAALVVALLSFGDVGAPTVRAVQAVQLVGLVGIVPAAVVLLQRFRGHHRWTSLVGAAAVLVALGVLGVLAVVTPLLSLSVSY